MKVLGVDPSTNGTAMVLVENNKFRIETTVDQKKLKLPKSITNAEEFENKLRKLKHLHNSMLTFLLSTKPDAVVVEGYSFGGKRALTGQAEVTGMFLLALKKYMDIRIRIEEDDFKILIVQPTQVKKFVSDDGFAKKELVLKQVFKLYNFDTDNNNVADAFVMAKMGYAYFNKTKDLSSFQKKVLDKITFFKPKKKGKKKGEEQNDL